MFQSQDTLKYNYSQICGILLSRFLALALEYGVSFFKNASDAILLNTILASSPITPVEENTKGENELAIYASFLRLMVSVSCG